MDSFENLNKKKKMLVEGIKKLNKEFEKNSISKEDYETEKNKLERELVQVMDYLVQYKFIMSGK